MVLLGLPDGVLLDFDGPYRDEEERKIAMLRPRSVVRRHFAC